MRKLIIILAVCCLCIPACQVREDDDVMSGQDEVIVLKLNHKKIFDDSDLVEEGMMSPVSYDFGYTRMEDMHAEALKVIEGEGAFDPSYEVLMVKDGFLVCGVDRESWESPYSEAVLTKLDLEGKSLWTKKLKADDTGKHISNLFMFENGDIGIVLGEFGQDGRSKAEIFRVDDQGDPVWSVAAGADWMYSEMKVVLTEDQRLIIAGEGYVAGITSDPGPCMVHVMEYDSNGKVLKEAALGSSDEYDYLRNMVYDRDIGLVITGWTNGESGDFLYRLRHQTERQ